MQANKDTKQMAHFLSKFPRIENTSITVMCANIQHAVLWMITLDYSHIWLHLNHFWVLFYTETKKILNIDALLFSFPTLLLIISMFKKMV